MSNGVSTNKKTLINVFCSLVLLCTNLVISFFLSPYIVKNIGVEANGFIQLANNFVTYAQLIVTALNGMAARYITLEYTKQNYNKANLFYNSVFWGNIFIVLILFVPAVFMIFKLESLLNIPTELIFDVKVLFSIVFMNFFLGVAFPNWECGTYVTNNLNRTYIPQAFLNILKCGLIFILFICFSPHVWFVGVAVSISTVLMLIVNCINTHELTPQLYISIGKNKILYSFDAIKKLIGSGIWNSVANAGSIMLTGLNLLICNTFLGAREMGIFSLSQIFYSVIFQLAHSLRSAFAPEMTILYANGDRDKLLKVLNKDVKIATILITVPLGGIIAFGDIFYKLWIPSQDSSLLYSLTILSLLNLFFTSGIQILYNIFSIVDKVKDDAIQTVVSGIISISLNLLLLKFTNLGLYSIASVTAIVNIIRYLVITLPGLAKYLGYKPTQFYPHVGFTLLSISLITIIGVGIRNVFPINNWFAFVLIAFFTGIFGFITNFLIFLRKEERLILLQKFWNKFKK